MTMLTRIGNSQGVRIPKPLIKQAHLEDANLEFEVLANGLLIKPVNHNAREAWSKNIQAVLTKNKNNTDEALLIDLLDDSDLEEYQW